MEEQTSPARAYLEQLASAGVLDSSGAFTVGKKAALGKLGAFQLPRESAWILKVVQCAVSWGAVDIDVKQRRNQTSFAFESQQPFDLDAVRQAMTSTDSHELAYVQHLAVALRAVGSGQGRPLALLLFHGENLRILRWDGETLFFDVETLQSPVEGWVLELQVNFERKGAPGLFRSTGAARKSADESLELTTRASVCPVALRLDGRRLDILTPSRSDQKTPSVAPLCLAWSEPAEDEQEALRLPSGISFKEPLFKMTNRIVDKRVYLLLGDQKERSSKHLLRLSYHYEVGWDIYNSRYEPRTRAKQASWLHGVVDGVVCDSVKLAERPSSLQADIYYSAQGLPTDISGLSLIEKGEELVERRRAALRFASSSLDILNKRLSGHGGPYLKMGGLVGAGILASFVGLPALTPLLVMLGIIGSPAIVMAGIEVGRANALIRRLVADIKSNLGELKDNLR